MANQFEVDVDNSGRIQGFSPEGFPGVTIGPEDMGENIDGGERVTLGDTEYDLLPNGSLVHPDVEITSSVTLEAGVRIDEGTIFNRFHPTIIDPRDSIKVARRARLKAVEIDDQVEIDEFALVLAKFIGGSTKIGIYARIGSGVGIGYGVKIGNTAKIDRDSQIGHHAVIERAVRLGYRTTVGEGAKIGHHSKIGMTTGAGPRGVNQDGPYIQPQEIVSAKTVRLH